jgi:hypothetical protein
MLTMWLRHLSSGSLPGGVGLVDCCIGQWAGGWLGDYYWLVVIGWVMVWGGK